MIICDQLYNVVVVSIFYVSLVRFCAWCYVLGKTIILATHAVSFLRYADNIIVMNEGKIQMQGVLQDLYDPHINLTKFVLCRFVFLSYFVV